MTAARVVALVASGAILWSCARPQAPQGGPVPETFLTVSETRPANLSTVEPFDGPVQIRFPRTMSQRLTRGSPRDAVVVSPQTGEVEVRTSGAGLEISMEGGFTAGSLYQITVLPRFQDRFQNSMGEAFNLFFSTGPEFEPNLVAGLVSERLTLQEVQEARVDASRGDEGVVRSVVSDSTGVFSLPYLPSGSYTLVAYEDGNRDGEPGFVEIQDSVDITVSPGDTLIVAELALLAPDTTAAMLDEVDMGDSLSVVATFDDYIDPTEPLDGVGATVTPEEGEPIEVTEIVHVAEWQDRQAADAAAAPPDPDAPGDDPDGAPADPAVDPTPPPGPQPGAQQDDAGPVLPARELVLILSVPPLLDTPYEVTIEGVRNINGIPDGGGSAELMRTAPPPALPAADPDAPGAGDTPPDSIVNPDVDPDALPPPC